LQGVEKRWVVDVDSKDKDLSEFIKLEIDRIWVNTHPNDWGRLRESAWLISEIPTLNGVHYITRPFNLQEFSMRFSETEVKKNGLTALYVPQCICEKI